MRFFCAVFRVGVPEDRTLLSAAAMDQITKGHAGRCCGIAALCNDATAVRRRLPVRQTTGERGRRQHYTAQFCGTFLYRTGSCCCCRLLYVCSRPSPPPFSYMRAAMVCFAPLAFCSGGFLGYFFSMLCMQMGLTGVPVMNTGDQ